MIVADWISGSEPLEPGDAQLFTSDAYVVISADSWDSTARTMSARTQKITWVERISRSVSVQLEIPARACRVRAQS